MARSSPSAPPIRAASSMPCWNWPSGSSSAADPRAALTSRRSKTPRPKPRTRSVARLFCDEGQDKAWFHDRDFWPRLSRHAGRRRFNRFNLTLGWPMTFPQGVTGDYLHFPYPYLVAVPGYDRCSVEPPLAAGERRKIWDALRSSPARRRARPGLPARHLDPCLCLDRQSQFRPSHRRPDAARPTPPYCRDALAMILKACPEITGITMRIHGESGIPGRQL